MMRRQIDAFRFAEHSDRSSCVRSLAYSRLMPFVGFVMIRIGEA